MKILFLSGEMNFADGVSNHLCNLLSELDKEKEIELYLICPGGEAIEKLKDSNVIILLNKNLNHESRSLLNFSKAYFDLRKYFRNHQIDVVHSHNHYAANIVGRVAKNSNIRTVQTIHGLIPEGGRLKHFYADKYISLNDKITDHLIKNNIAEVNNIFNFRQGIPEDKFFRKKLFNSEKNDDVPVILHASRLINGKGADIFIKASAEVRKKYQGKLRFVIAGSGDQESELKKLSVELSSEIDFTGSVKEIFPLMKSADIFVNSTALPTEGFPMTIAEAAFSGCLLISSKGIWLNEVFEKGEDGFSYEVNDHIELSDKILIALERKDLSQKMAESFQSKAKELFSINNFTENHKFVYQECLKKNYT